MEIWGAALAVAGGVYGAGQARGAAKDAARGQDAATALQREMYEQGRTDQMPWLEAGRENLAELDRLNSGDYSSFMNSPDYQFALDQGIKGVDRSASARGTQFSGGQLAELARFSGGLASQNYGNYYNRISQLAGVGQTAASNLASSGQGYANSLGQLAVGRGMTDAYGRLASSSAYGQGLEQAGNAFGKWWQGRQRPPATGGGGGGGFPSPS